MINFIIGFLSIVSTYGVYLLSKKVHQKWDFTFTFPVILSTVIIILILLVMRIPYEIYMIGGKWINELLGVAVVALAYPLYQQRENLKKLALPIISGTLIGAAVGVSTGTLFAKVMGFEDILIHSLSPKSVTAPVAMSVADTVGGLPTLAVVFVMIAGFGGVFLKPIIYKVCRINHVVGKGVGIGSASHAIGTASALESSLLEGSVSTSAMVVSAVVVSLITPGLVNVLL